MSRVSISAGKMLLLGGAAMLAAAVAPVAAQAEPYAFAANQITGLSLTGAFTPLGTATTSATATSFFGGVAGAGSTGNGLVGDALDITRSAIGGNAPSIGENVFTAQGPAGYSGSRADASIGAGVAPPLGVGVSVNNVAETGGNLNGQATGQNTANINFQITSTGGTVTLSLTDQIRLIAATSALQGETANATVTNTFEITNSAGNVVFSESPNTINRQASSTGGIPGISNINPGPVSVTLTSGALIAGETYTISLRSIASVTTTVGTPVPVPEPMSLALFGMGLAGLGLVRRRRA